ncbi:hypothetical protein Neosp_003606 [[Neocosmospora] mangrovei]
MGNTQSAEAPRRHRKLSKPPVCTYTSAAGLPYDATAVTPHHEHFSNSYLVGSLPPPPKQASSTRVAPAGIGIAVPVDDVPSPLSSPTCRDARRDSMPRNGVLRSQSVQSEQPPRMPSSVNRSRASSIAHDGTHCSLTRAESMPMPMTALRGSASYDTRSPEGRQLQLLNAKKLPSEPIITFESLSEISQDVTDDTNNGNQSAGTPISRTNSDVSLYMPMRRRSVIQKPGVATRAHHSNHPISAKSSFRNSHPPSPSQTRHNSIESDLVRRMSLPSIPSRTQSPERVTTPTEADYRQLGGMKFGSLRITNGAPVATPVPEDDVKVQGVSESAWVSPREGYFDVVDPSTLAKSNVAELSEPVTSGQPVTAARGTVAEPLSGPAEPRTCGSEMSEKRNADSFPVAEVLDVREDPNAKPSPEKIQQELDDNMFKGLIRTDSGFIPSPSFESTRPAASKVDSGYSSNVSLRSLPSLRSAATDRSTMTSDRLDSDVTGISSPSDSNSTRTSSLAPSQTHNRLPIHLEVPLQSTDDEASTCPTTPTSPTSQTSRSFSSFALGSRRRLSSLTSTKSEVRTSKSGQDVPVPIIITEEHTEKQLSPPSRSDDATGRKLYRFLSGTRKKGPPKVRKVRTIEREDPTNPPPAQELRGLVAGIKSMPQTPGLRGEPSKDTLQTILSEGNQDPKNGMEPQKDTAGGANPETPRKISRRHSWRQSFAQMFGSRSPSVATVAEHEAETSQTIQSRPASGVERRATQPNITRSPRNVGPRQVPRKHSGSSSNSGSPTKASMPRSALRDRRDKPELAHLRTNVSAPNLSETRRSPHSPARSELNSALRTRTSPPVSMQTRSGKPSRGKVQGHSRSMTPSHSRNSSRPTSSRRLSLPQDLSRPTLQSRHSTQAAQGYVEPRSPNWSKAMALDAGSQQVQAAQQPRVLSYSSTGVQQSVVTTSQVRQHRRASAPPQGFQAANVPRSRSHSTLLQQQQQLQIQQQQQQQLEIQHRHQQQIQLQQHQQQLQIQQQQLHQQQLQQQQIQQQQLQQRVRHQSQPSLQAWTPVEAYNLNQQLQQNYMLQNPGVVYGTPNMIQQHPDIYVTNPVHRRASSQGSAYGQNPPFRVLHSYNSPAYRGAPIWG